MTIVNKGQVRELWQVIDWNILDNLSIFYFSSICNCFKTFNYRPTDLLLKRNHWKMESYCNWKNQFIWRVWCCWILYSWTAKSNLNCGQFHYIHYSINPILPIRAKINSHLNKTNFDFKEFSLPISACTLLSNLGCIRFLSHILGQNWLEGFVNKERST